MNIRTWVRMPLQWSFRGKCLAGFGACAGVLLYALYVQFFDRLNPCPLCTFQRGVFVVLGLVFLGGALAGPKSRAGRIVVAGLAVLAASGGVAIAARHVWLQSLPPEQVPACGPDLAWMLQSWPLLSTVRQVFTGSGECAVIDWTFLGLSMPAWSLFTYVVLAIWAVLSASIQPFKTDSSR